MERDRITVLFLGILTVVAVGIVLKAAQAVVLPLIIAWLLSYILWPVVDFLRRRRIPTPVGVLLVLLLLLGGCFLVAIFMNTRVSAFAQEYPKYRARLTEITTALTAGLNLPSDPLTKVDWGERIGAFVVGLSGSFVSFTSNLVTVIIFLVFLLLGKPYFPYKVKKAFSSERGEQITRIAGSISDDIGSYLSVQFLISFITGGLVWITLAIIGVDFAVTWGALVFFLNFIPTIGSIVASIPPILLALVQFYPNYWPAVLCFLALLAIQMVMGNVVSPKVMGDRLDLSPVVILLSLLFWGWLWGVVGALLSTPIASAIKIACENVEPLRPISVMMGTGRKCETTFQENEGRSSPKTQVPA